MDKKKETKKKTNKTVRGKKTSNRKEGSPSGRNRGRNARLLKNRKALLMDLVSSKNYEPMRLKDIAMILQVPKAKRHELEEVMDLLVQEGKINILSEGRYEKSRGAVSGTEISRKRAGERGKQKEEHAGYGSRKESIRRKASAREESETKKPRIQTPDIPAVIEAYDLPEDFPARVTKQAERCPETVIAGDLEGRMDLRGWQMVTIDGEDAKDLDDAVSVTREGKNFRLGVHIADVSNYVQENSALDREALKRGTSVYLPDRVLPMLPRRLSNGICSLNEGEDRLALSCIMLINEEGEVIEHKIRETVICVDRRMTYQDVNDILTDPEHHPELLRRYRELLPMFHRMADLSERIRRNRRKRGAIDFDFPESKVILDEDGTPVDIRPYPANTATRMIEDFMLAANETVAKEYALRKIPFLYRVHDRPDPEKMEETLTFIREQGIQVEKKQHQISPKEVQTILSGIQNQPEEPLISRLMLRSMAKAVYSPSCTGHFGLAAPYYCHFTSPIRRYPDLQIHRIIKDDLRGRLNRGTRMGHYSSLLPHVAEQASAMEQRAAEAEREAVKLKKAEYMLEHVGEEYEGVISGVTGWGFYVELPNTVEGLVSVMTLKDDYFRLDEEKMILTGDRTGMTFSLGEPVRIRVRGAEPANRTIDFTFVEKI